MRTSRGVSTKVVLVVCSVCECLYYVCAPETVLFEVHEAHSIIYGENHEKIAYLSLPLCPEAKLD